MPYPTYPTENDIQSILGAIDVEEPPELATIVAGVVGDWKVRTGHRQFLAAATASTRAYDPPYDVRGFVLSLGTGFVTIDSVEIADAELDATEYDLLPLNAAADGRGWSEIRFRGHPGFEPASIGVTGRVGLYAELPPDVYSVLVGEMVRRAVNASPNQTLTASRIRQGGVDVEFPTGIGGQTIRLSDAEGAFRSAVMRYRRID